MVKGRMQGSLTVEAAFVLPIFVFAALTVLYLNKFLLLEEKVQWALVRTAREASVEYAVSKNNMTVNPAYLTVKMNRYLGEECSVSMWKSRFYPETDTINLTAEYTCQIPFPIVSGRTFTFAERMTTRAFTGVRTRLETENEDGNVIVYVTKSGTVYHRKRSCTHLTLHLSEVKYSDLQYLRSESGGIYYACEKCWRQSVPVNGQTVIICNYGDRYHSERSCPKIKKSIQEIRLSEAGGRQPCTKCGKE